MGICTPESYTRYSVSDNCLGVSIFLELYQNLGISSPLEHVKSDKGFLRVVCIKRCSMDLTVLQFERPKYFSQEQVLHSKACLQTLDLNLELAVQCP